MPKKPAAKKNTTQKNKSVFETIFGASGPLVPVGQEWAAAASAAAAPPASSSRKKKGKTRKHNALKAHNEAIMSRNIIEAEMAHKSEVIGELQETKALIEQECAEKIAAIEYDIKKLVERITELNRKH